MGNLYLLFTTRTKNYQFIQAHKRQNRLRMSQHNSPTHQASHRPNSTPEQRGVYQLTCKTCNLSYVGQTNRNMKTRFQEHIRYIKTNNPPSAYAQNILHIRHECGTLNKLMTLLKLLQHENMLLPYKQYHTQFLHQAGKLIPEQCPGDPNPLFQLAFNSQPPYTRQDRESRAGSRKPDT